MIGEKSKSPIFESMIGYDAIEIGSNRLEICSHCYWVALKRADLEFCGYFSSLYICSNSFPDWSELILEMKHLVMSQDMQVVHFLSQLHTTVFQALHI